MPSHPSSPNDRSLMATNRWRWSALRKQVLTRDGRRCQIRIEGICTIDATEVDHIRPRGLAGVDDLGNLRSVCKPCHLARGMHSAPARGGGSGPSAVVTRDYTKRRIS